MKSFQVVQRLILVWFGSSMNQEVIISTLIVVS